jgi:hypothetical protein
VTIQPPSTQPASATPVSSRTPSDSARQQHESDVRDAARSLLQAVERLRPDYSTSLDMSRLVLDAGRVAEDVSLLLGVSRAVTADTRDVIPDGDYPPGFFADAEDEGVGRHR